MAELKNMDDIALEMGKVCEETRAVLDDLAKLREAYIVKFVELADLAKRDQAAGYLYRSLPQDQKRSVERMPMPPVASLAITERNLRGTAEANGWMPA